MRHIFFFRILSVFLVGVFLFGTVVSLFSVGYLTPLVSSLGLLSGKSAIVLYILSLFPGIVRRFGLRHRIFFFLMHIRRQVGITTYACIILHSWFLFFLPFLSRGAFPFISTSFQLFGLAASSILFLLFVTSNDASLKRLRVWWYRLHRMTYVALFFVFLHVTIRPWSIWMVLMGVTGILEILSFLIASIRARQRDVLSPAVSSRNTPML